MPARPVGDTAVPHTGASAVANAAPARPPAPLLDDLMPWSMPGIRTGRDWVVAPDPETLRLRWRTLLAGDDPEHRAALLGVTRRRTPHSVVAGLPGHPATSTAPLAEEGGPCPEPVRFLRGPWDRQWIIPDHRLIDSARPEWWRAVGPEQWSILAPAPADRSAGDGLVATADPADARFRRRAARVHPLYRSADTRSPNLAPGLLPLLERRLGLAVDPEDVAAYTVALLGHHGATGPAPRPAAPADDGWRVPLTADPQLWRRGVELGRQAVWLHTRGRRCADPAAGREGGRPRLPGGRRPFVRESLVGPGAPAPDAVAWEPAGAESTDSLLVGAGRVAPVSRSAWEYRCGGERVLGTWFAAREPARRGDGEPLAAVFPTTWPKEWTSDLLDLVSLLTLLAEAEPEQRRWRRAVAEAATIDAAELRAAGVLPVPASARRPAGLPIHPEEGPGGQTPLW
ncbi:type ISP restriction/modification enzyme [Allostreptomyces psammosilenae]|uniref:Type ISP restriction-modification enzyme LLaBIII C-terminal specificity domain-containing protein n=1 Tax=Allostreptomyces psammosilenae TaxID=1892865 RepID=A0A853A301_9ACTN|nr:type ISP restriction/modification enzyme [Allostreptomyces psammosilenae]NYI04848.1 hypothetical protein [Allostreptomyces psammosilenae]